MFGNRLIQDPLEKKDTQMVLFYDIKKLLFSQKKANDFFDFFFCSLWPEA